MVGITLSPEQINQAPPEVRRWLEQQISATLGLYRPQPAMIVPEQRLIGFDREGARAVLSLIQGALPVAAVFFELGREPVGASPQGLRALRLDDMVHGARLQSPEQLVACLQTINVAAQRVCDNPEAVLTILDGSGHCLVADVTAQNILALWQEIMAAHNLPRQDSPVMRDAPYSVSMPLQSPYTMSMPPVVPAEGPPGSAASA